MIAPVLSPADVMFRCERGGGNGPPCTMLKRACIERQAKSHKRPGPGRSQRATFPFCAGGNCEQGTAIAAEVGPLEPRPARQARNWGSVPALVRAAAVARRKREEAAAAASSSDVEKEEVPTEPPAQPVQEETTMPTGIRSTPCPGCGTTGSKHRAVNGKDCPERGKSGRAKAAPKAKKIRVAIGPATLSPAQAAAFAAALRARSGKKVQPAPTTAHVLPVAQLSDEDLAKSIAQARAELVRRREECETRANRLAEIERSISEAA